MTWRRLRLVAIGCSVASGLITTVIAVSFFRQPLYVWSVPATSQYHVVGIGHGSILVGTGGLVGVNSTPWDGWSVYHESPASQFLMPEFARGLAVVPLWMMLLPLCGVGAFALWRMGHVPAWRCRACGYDLRACASEACPECGADAGEERPGRAGPATGS